MADPDTPPDFHDDTILVQRADADLYVERVGPRAAPAVYYLHGGPGYSSHSFRELVGEDLERYLMLYVDQRGGGRSYGAGSADPAVLADDVRAVLDALDLGSVSLLAHGFGALIAVEVARLWPERVGRLVLVAPWFSMPLLAEDLLLAARRIRAGGVAADADEAQADTIGTSHGAGTSPDDGVLGGDPAAASDEAFSLVNPKALFDALQFPQASSRMHLEHADAEALLGPQEAEEPIGVWERDVLDVLPTLSVPVVVLAGRLDGTCFPRQVEAGLERMPWAQVSLFDAGHYPWLDDPEGFEAVLHEALAVPAAASRTPS